MTVSPTFFQIFHLPFACDLIGFASLILAVWWTRKLGTATSVGFVALIINMLVRPTALHFFGFFAASVVFDILIFLSRYRRLEHRLIGSAILFASSVFSATIAGLIIGSFFMQTSALIQWGGILGWAGLHAIGGVIGGGIGVTLTNALSIRHITPRIGSTNRG